ncbi:MAG: biotin--[acetyl-CoA-carboxylase] ligase, partial [Eubacteriales bacterium]|nr:biotin--[acetyl-CoA-carboxylase] ligase [Eubacteriales bacterium]
DLSARIPAAFLNRFLPYYRELPSRSFLDGYRSRQYLIGKKIDIIKEGSPDVPAIALDIDDECRLLVRPDGSDSAIPLSFGEVRARRSGILTN